MAIEGIKEEKVAEVSADAVATLLDSTDSTVAVPAGLYYKITSATSLPIVSASGTGTPSTGAAAAPPSKPGDDKGFFKVELRATPFAAE